MILHVCPRCREVRNYSEMLAGRQVTCQACRETFTLPSNPKPECALPEAPETDSGLHHKRS